MVNMLQIDKSHPIHVRNDNNKKRKKVGVPATPPSYISVVELPGLAPEP
jgi:hypothetical protein